MATPLAARHGVLGDTATEDLGIPRIHRGWLIALGIGLILLGTVALFVPLVTTLTSVVVFGWAVFFGGAMEIAAAIAMRGWRGVLLHVLSGILGMVVGAMVFMHPAAGALALTLLLASLFLVGGIFRIIAAIVIRFPRWGWAVASGVITVALGVVVWTGWPLTSLWVIGTLVAIELVFRGWAWVMAGAAMR
jgi:uncharacterized membrane protein HdeD (DUF308 family)